MPHLNIKKFQNTPRGEDGRASAGEKRIRFEQREIVSEDGKRIRVLHPTKGWRDRSISRVAFGMVPNAPVHVRKQKYTLIKIEGTKNEFYRQDIQKNKYAGRRRP